MKEPVELTVSECLGLLGEGVVGRVALSTPIGPRIVPVNYAMYDDAIIFRTSPYSELGSHGSGSQAAFEIDQLGLRAPAGVERRRAGPSGGAFP